MKKRIFVLILAVILCALIPLSASANSAEPPCFTIMVINPPEELELFIEADGELIKLGCQRRGWESYYRFFYHMAPSLTEENSAKILAKYENESFYFEVEDFKRYSNNLYTLDMDKRAAKSGQPLWRGTALVAMRVGLTLLIEGIIFFLFGYRKRISWIIFVAVNLLTQIFINILISGPVTSGYVLLGFFLMEIVVFIVEMIIFPLLLREKKWYISLIHAFTANAASLVLGSIIISNLPI